MTVMPLTRPSHRRHHTFLRFSWCRQHARYGRADTAVGLMHSSRHRLPGLPSGEQDSASGTQLELPSRIGPGKNMPFPDCRRRRSRGVEMAVSSACGVPRSRPIEERSRANCSLVNACSRRRMKPAVIRPEIATSDRRRRRTCLRRCPANASCRSSSVVVRPRPEAPQAACSGPPASR